MSDTTDTSYSRSTSSNKPRRAPAQGRTKFERDIDAAINRGVSNCRNNMHWHTVKVADDKGKLTWTDVQVKGPRAILSLMQPGAARCMCERTACQWAWSSSWNHKGMFTTRWVLPGQEQMGIPHKEKEKDLSTLAAKRVWPLNHALPEKKLALLSASFPEWHFVNSMGASHDHPLAHYRTKLASERLMDKLPCGTPDSPKVYIDLHGNPGSNAAFMRRNPGIVIVTLVECITPKDFINRATKWGPKFREDGFQMWYDDMHVRDIPRDMEGLGLVISGFISVHTTYYYDAAEISALLAWAPNAVLYTMMHRFEGMTGKLNDGEQTWDKHQTSFGYRVTQRNVKTSEAYEHPDNAWWYENDSRICGDNAIGWTMGELCDETYYFLVCSVPVVQARMSPKGYGIDIPEPPSSTGKAQSKKAMLSSRQVEVSLCGTKAVAPLDPLHVDFFDDMRKHMIGKGRGPKEYKDHVARCKVSAKGLMSEKKIAVESQQLSDITRMSFMIDFEDNYGNDVQMFSAAYVKVIQADHLYKHGNNIVSMGALSLLSEMLMDAVDSKTMGMAAVKATRTGIDALRRRGVINVVK